ncbi:Crp/Fnr family transcriptional regulator [Streptomyces sp. DSM 42041]|uniref:Crp/Fnr family transcriptional regulator n=1 Tax=Streptomyces hazeniae TaxID=3075538 RepID=A0ABU2NZA7_9ACTN|nr:Crp/Fnr family transcriptional regulator [Streptomyces sp. DSM 42041]MDT0382030.1 Crp/Fnr family transcriptional regulator [Streptomyces sp. DSM 42041]
MGTEGVSINETFGDGGTARPTGRDPGSRTGLGDQVPFLARLEAHDRAALLALGRRLRFAPGDALLRQHEPSTHVLFVLRGWTKVSSEAANGYEALLALRGPGDIVGEVAALSGRPRSATVRAMGEVQAVAVDQERFTAFLASTPHVALRLLSLTTDRMRDSDSRRLEFAALNVRERLAMLLLELARTHGEHTDEGIRLTSGLSQYELAGSVGASREAVARLLRELRQRGIVRTGRRGLVLVKPEQLRRMRRAD